MTLFRVPEISRRRLNTSVARAVLSAWRACSRARLLVPRADSWVVAELTAEVMAVSAVPMVSTDVLLSAAVELELMPEVVELIMAVCFCTLEKRSVKMAVASATCLLSTLGGADRAICAISNASQRLMVAWETNSGRRER